MMSEDYVFSNEIIKVFDSAVTYQNTLKSFLSIQLDKKIIDLKHALKNKNLMFHALKIVENMPDAEIEALLEELIYVNIFGNVSYAHMAKQIILGLDMKSLRSKISDIVRSVAVNHENDIDILKDLALLLYSAHYKHELLQFVNIYLDQLKESEFIEDDDTSELYKLKDLEDL